MSIKAPKGCRDIFEPEVKQIQYLERVYRETAEAYGFMEIRVPTFEQTELFQRGVGETTDIVNKEMYTFMDKGGRSMTLRPEGTAGVVRAYLEHGMANWPSPVKLYYNYHVFRYERPQKGRFREFQQFGMELFGAPGAMGTAEILSFLHSFFQRLGLHDYSLQLNSIGCQDCRPVYNETLRSYLALHREALCPDCQSRLERNPLRCLDCKNPKCQEIMAEAPLPSDCLCASCAEEEAALLEILARLGVSYELNRQLVRGLDYYTGTVFEFVSDELGAQSAFCGGGRYDNLVAELGGAETPAVGFAFGVERLRLELEAKGLLPEGETRPVLQLISFADTADEALILAAKLRQTGLRIETDILGRSFKAQMKQASRLEPQYIAILGVDELAAGQVELKRQADGQTEKIALEALAQFLLEGERRCQN